MHKGKLFIVSAPSGAGKTSLVTALVTQMAEKCLLSRVVTYTTKKPRQEEINGRDYHFISPDQFQRKIEEDFFLEWSLAYGSYYGSPRSIISLLQQGSSFLMILDQAGAQSVTKTIPEAILIWITVKNIETLKTRLLVRNSETIEQIQQRIMLAQKEIMQKKENKFFKYTVLNDEFEKALLELKTIIKKELFVG